MTAPFDRKGAMKKPPGHDARRPLLRLPVSPVPPLLSTTGLRPEGSASQTRRPATGGHHNRSRVTQFTCAEQRLG
jgi:hypothetical protein